MGPTDWTHGGPAPEGVARLEPVPTSEHFFIRNCAKKDLFLRPIKHWRPAAAEGSLKNLTLKKSGIKTWRPPKNKGSWFYPFFELQTSLGFLVERKNCKVMEKKWNSCRLCQDVFFGRVLSMLLLPTSFRSKKKRISTFISAIPVPVDQWSTGRFFNSSS